MNRTGDSPAKLLVGIACAALVPLSASGASAQNVDMGPTYDLLDRQVTEVRTEFVDAQVVTRRTPKGMLESTLFSPGGIELGKLRASPETRDAEVRLSRAGNKYTQLPALPGVRTTTDWANLQLYSLWKEACLFGSLPALSGRLAVDGALVRISETPRQSTFRGAQGSDHVRKLRRQERSVTTVFGNLVARAQRSDALGLRPRSAETGTYTATYTTYLVNQRTGKTLGLARYFEEAKVFVWDFEPLSSGFASDQTVPGGWNFEHNMAWSNIQVFSFWYFHRERVAARGTALQGTELGTDLGTGNSSAGTCQSTTDPLLGKTNVLGRKNEIGCDGLHWLDDTVYRECCDQHDACYGYDPQSNEQTADDPCTFWSWLFVEGWRCTKCNIDVIHCFLSKTFDGGGGGTDGGGGGDSCTVSGAEWCPAECFSCDRQAF